MSILEDEKNEIKYQIKKSRGRSWSSISSVA